MGRIFGRVQRERTVASVIGPVAGRTPRASNNAGFSLIEALACGRPILAAAGGGTPELLGDAGVLAPPEDPDTFTRLLDSLLHDSDRRAALGAAARRRAVERYSVDRMVRDYGEALEAL